MPTAPHLVVQSEAARALREARRALGVTQEALAEVSSRVHVSRIERGLKQPTIRKFDSLAEALKIHPLTLLALCYVELEDQSGAESLLLQVSSELEAMRRV